MYETERRTSIFLLAICLSLLAQPAAAGHIELGADTLQAWNQHIQAMQARSRESNEPGKAFLRVDAHPAKLQMLREGRILVWPATEGGATSVPSGLLHDWVGAIFIPDATLDQVLAVVRDFDSYEDHYEPSVTRSELLGNEGDDYRFRLRLQRTVLKKAVTVDCNFREQFVDVGPGRVFGSSLSTSVQEVKHDGGAQEHHLPDGVGGGYLWRLGAEARFEAADGGVYLELEAVALSRDIPVMLRLLLEPIVRGLSRSALEDSLRQTREAVLVRSGKKTPLPQRHLLPARAE